MSVPITRNRSLGLISSTVSKLELLMKTLLLNRYFSSISFKLLRPIGASTESGDVYTKLKPASASLSLICSNFPYPTPVSGIMVSSVYTTTLALVLNSICQA